MALIKLLLFAYLAVCVVGAFVSVVIAAIDIWRWHQQRTQRDMQIIRALLKPFSHLRKRNERN